MLGWNDRIMTEIRSVSRHGVSDWDEEIMIEIYDVFRHGVTGIKGL